jgi:hypothetical protein
LINWIAKIYIPMNLSQKKRTYAKDRPQRIAAMYKTFANVLGAKLMGTSEWNGEKLSEEVAVSMVIRTLRAILGTEELTSMRVAFVKNALKEL